MTAIQVVVVDDQALVSAAFRQILDAHGIDVVGSGDGRQAIAEVERCALQSC